MVPDSWHEMKMAVLTTWRPRRQTLASFVMTAMTAAQLVAVKTLVILHNIFCFKIQEKINLVHVEFIYNQSNF
jgi:hypothetical protein